MSHQQSAGTGSTSPAVQISELGVTRGPISALTNLSFDIFPGTITGLLGPSGAGKTTLIRAIVGVQIITSGQVRIFGHPAGSTPLRSQIGYVTQAPSVYTDLTVRENVQYFASLYGLRGAAIDEALGNVGLAKEADQLTANLSGGQSSRVSLACALVGKPKLLVLDEPTVGQDPVLREELWGYFRRQAEQGTTVIVSSHVMDEATRCDRLILLRSGRMIADDTPDQILAAAGTTSMDEAFLELIRAQDVPALDTLEGQSR